jgi:hypothetical protein
MRLMKPEKQQTKQNYKNIINNVEFPHHKYNGKFL